jgi:hypothetical protein
VTIITIGMFLKTTIPNLWLSKKIRYEILSLHKKSPREEKPSTRWIPFLILPDL